MFFNDAAREMLETLAEIINDMADARQEYYGNEASDEPALTLDDEYRCMNQAEQACRKRYGSALTNLYLEQGRADESPEEFLERYEDQYEYLREWLNRPEELEDMSLDDFEDWKKCKDYGLTEDELDDD